MADGGNGHVYELVRMDGPITWTAARDAAAAMTYAGSVGHLVTVTSSAEDDFLRNKFSAYIGDPNTNVPGVFAWIGLSDAASEGNFQWVTGEAFTYSNWAPPEPNNLGDEDYIYVWRRKFTGLDVDPNGTITWSWNDSSNIGSNTIAQGGYLVEYDGPFTASVPEPATLIIFVAGFVGLSGFGRLNWRCNDDRHDVLLDG